MTNNKVGLWGNIKRLEQLIKMYGNISISELMELEQLNKLYD